jgi:hypothetical protein
MRLERALHGTRVHGVTTNLSRSSGLAATTPNRGYRACRAAPFTTDGDLAPGARSGR